MRIPAQLKAHQMKLKISQMYRMSATEQSRAHKLDLNVSLSLFDAVYGSEIATNIAILLSILPFDFVQFQNFIASY